VRRGGNVLALVLRELLAPQKYRCALCDFRWLAWPWLYRGRGVLGGALRALRRVAGGTREWSPP
jgi:hypothetical protein